MLIHMWYFCAIEYYVTLKENEVKLPALVWYDLQDILEVKTSKLQNNAQRIVVFR